MKPAGTLTVYRRHTRSCTKGYEQNERILRPRTATEKKNDCECPIVCSGTLRNEPRRLLHTSLETNDWDTAEIRAKGWEQWQATTDPSTSITARTIPTIKEACEKFLKFHGPEGKEWGDAYLQKYGHLFGLRLVPFAELHKLTLTDFEQKPVVNDLITSWRNGNPLRNRKLKPGEEIPDIPLGYKTKSKELERLRYTFDWFVDNEWMKKNPARNIKLKYEDVDPKYGLTPAEEERVFDSIELIGDGRGGLDGYNAKEMLVFCLVARHTGLRVNAIVNLDDSQLVPRESGKGYAIKVMYQQKTGWVRIPIPDDVEQALRSLSFKGEVGGKRYWFRTGQGKLKTAISSWRNRMSRLFRIAQGPDPETGKYRKPFDHPASTHTWRHTFAISHLNVGTDIKMVSRWLGHKSQAVTEKHYAHANRATNEASEVAYDESLRKQEALRKKTTTAGKKVVAMRRRA
jgi:integrase